MSIIIIIAIIALIVWVIFSFNGLTRKQNDVQESRSQIKVQLKRRADLIPSLVKTVKAYMKHESETFDHIAEMRAQMVNPNASLDEKMQANDQLTQALGKIMAISESYPELKASKNFEDLQEEITNTENKVSFSRQNYNNAVKVYNVATRVFPNSIFASLFRFKQAEYIEIDKKDEEKPEIDFD